MIRRIGGEGGGHTGDVPTSVLIPAVVDLCKGRRSALTGREVTRLSTLFSKMLIRVVDRLLWWRPAASMMDADWRHRCRLVRKPSGLALVLCAPKRPVLLLVIRFVYYTLLSLSLSLCVCVVAYMYIYDCI
jgi:hypothetical protein